MSVKIRIVLEKRKFSISALARSLNTTRNNLSNKLSRDNFSENELQQIAEILNCDFESNFILRDTGERI